MKKLYITFIVLLVLGIGAGIFYFTEYRQSKMAFPDDVAMETLEGNTYSFKDLSPKVRLLEFMYTNCPDICPNTTFQMKQLKEKLKQEGVFGDQVEFITITIDPKRDTKDVLREYAKTFDIHEDEGWYLLRGSEEDTLKVADAFNFKYRDPGNGMIIHSSFTYFLDENNRIVEIFGMGEKGFKKDEVFNEIMDHLD
jgi:protein SCO1